MKKILLILILVSVLPVAPVKADWLDYVPFCNSTVSENKENVILTEKEQLIQSAKKYAGIGTGLLALYLVLDTTSIRDCLEKSFDQCLIKSYNALCYITGNSQIKKICWYNDAVLYEISVEFLNTLLSIHQLSKLAGLACFGKAGYDLVKAPFAQADNTQETIKS